MNLFVQQMITMIGLAVGIDYSLFIVSRYREERIRGLEIDDAIALAGATASRAVFFSQWRLRTARHERQNRACPRSV